MTCLTEENVLFKVIMRLLKYVWSCVSEGVPPMSGVLVSPADFRILENNV
jgi:hypothetical protein